MDKRARSKAFPDAKLERTVGRIARNRMRIAWMYYVEGLTQNEIAEQLGIGRVTVVRNIKEALEQREVKIWVTGSVAECFELQARLKERFHLEDAMVVPDPANERDVSRVVGNAAGMYISEQLHDDMCIGVGWGATLHESLQTLEAAEFSDVEIISLLGGIVQARRFNPAEFAWQFANAVGADCYLLAAPAIVDSAATKQALIERCGLNQVLDRAKDMDMVLLSVGILSQQSTSFRFGFFSEEDKQSLTAKGAVGDVLFNFFNIDGKLVDHPINERVMSMPIEKLRQVPRRVMISGGNEKIEALIGAMRLVNGNVLVTNESTARGLLAHG